MKTTTFVLSLLAAAVAGCATQPPSSAFVAAADLPNCFDSNYDAERNLFTMRNAPLGAMNQQCALTVGSRLAAGSYVVYLAGGGGGGAGGTTQSWKGAGGAGGGGAGARETQATVQLTEGTYRLTLGAGGPGGTACVPSFSLAGGPGWLGSPSNIVRVATGEVIAGTPGAESYARPSRAQHDLSAGPRDGHGGYGPGQTSGGQGGTAQSMTGVRLAQSGEGMRARASAVGMGSTPGGNEDPTSAGGGGGGTSMADGGRGGGELPGHANRPPLRGLLGSGGGGGEGSRSECDAGAPGGHGYIALAPMASGTTGTAPVVAPTPAPVYVAPPSPAPVGLPPKKDRT
jgi:hypothetical protein